MQLLQPIAREGPRPRRWTRGEYHHLGELGWFHGQRVELIEGEIIVWNPQNWLHASTLDRVAEVLENSLGSGFWVRTQLPLNLGPSSEPEPDVSIVAGARADYHDHPTTARLVVEVSDSRLSYDRHPKAGLYARAGIPDYWIVNLVDRRLEVYRNPAPDPLHAGGFRYAAMTILTPADAVTPLAGGQARIAVADLLP